MKGKSSLKKDREVINIITSNKTILKLQKKKPKICKKFFLHKLYFS